MNDITYRGYSIERENSGRWSVYRFGYMNSFDTIEAAKKYIDGKLC